MLFVIIKSQFKKIASCQLGNHAKQASRHQNTLNVNTSNSYQFFSNKCLSFKMFWDENTSCNIK